MRRPYGLTREEAELWRKLASTVTPLRAARKEEEKRSGNGEAPEAQPAPQAARTRAADRQLPAPAAVPRPPATLDRHGPERHGLDGGWERKLARGLVEPDFTLDLHGASLDAAHGRLANGLAQAKAMGARVVLLITGRPRPVEAADRGHARGAIRAKVTDWIAAGEHAGDIAAIRGAHRRHGGPGALYLVLKRRR